MGFQYLSMTQQALIIMACMSKYIPEFDMD